MTRDEAPGSGLVVARVEELVGEIWRNDPLVRRQATESVHDMRVAIRRLRDALTMFRPVLDPDRTDPVRDELRWHAGVLAPARDAEVMHERLRQHLATTRPDELRGHAAERIDEELAARSKAAHDQIVASMDSSRYRALAASLQSLVSDPPWTTHPEQAPDALSAQVRRAVRRLDRRVRAAYRVEAGDERDLLLHAVRKAAKRVRYEVEPLLVLYDGHDNGAEALAQEVKRVQTILGDHQDAVVTARLLRELTERAVVAAEDAFTFGVLHAREARLATEAERAFAAAWREASRPKYRRWLD